MKKSVRYLALLVIVAGLGGCDAFVSNEARLSRARDAMAKGETSSAIIDVRNVLEKEPANSQARLLLAELSLQQGDGARARQELDRLASAGQLTPHATELLTRLRLQMGDAEGALAAIDGGKLSLEEPIRSTLRARALMALRRAPEARMELERVLQSHPKSAEARTALAEMLAIAGHSDDSIVQLTQAIQDEPGRADAYLVQAEILVRRGQFAAAEQSLLKARTLTPLQITAPQRAMVLSLLGESQLGQSKLDAASGTQRELARVAAQWPITQLLASRIELAKGDYTAATSSLQQLVSRAPDLVQARMALGIAHAAQGNLRQAENQLAQVVERAPENIEARKLLARVRLQLESPDTALQALGVGEDVRSSDSQLYALAGAAYMQAGNRDAAIGALEKAAKASPSDARLQLDLAEAYVVARRFQQAMDVLHSVPELAGDGRRERLILAAIRADKGVPAVRAELERMLAQKPDEPRLLYLAAAFYASENDIPAARAVLNRVVQKNPADSRALAGLGELELRSGNPQGAEAALKQAVKANPKDAGVHFALARFYLVKGDVTPARESLDAAVATAPTRPELVALAGRLLLAAQRYDQALERFRKAAELAPDQPIYWEDTARAQLALNQPTAARESIDKALKLQPDLGSAERLLVLIELRTGGAKAALARVQDMRRRDPNDVETIVLEGDVQAVGNAYREAAQAYADAERIRPSSLLAMKAHQALLSGKLENPQAPLVRWLAKQPDDLPPRLLLAGYYQSSNQLKNAIGEFETLARLQPNSPVVLNNLAWTYQEAGDRRARDIAKRAYELAPDNASIADTYGWILFQNKDASAALPLLDRAASKAESNLQIQYHLAAALAATGDKTRAKGLLQRVTAASEAFPERAEAQQLLMQLGT
jgi:tetratricopeptide (TPR) repeat protein